jgi:hypothetical protein
MAIMHLMVPSFTILGRLAMPSQLLSIFIPLKLIPSSGYDHIIQERIYHFLDTDNRFRAQIADLLASEGTEIEIEEEMSYHSFVTFLTSCCISIELDV